MSEAGRGASLLAWTRRLVPAALGAGLLYLVWRLVTANAQPVSVDFLVAQVELAAWEALLGSFIAGALLVGLYTLYQMARGGLVSRRYRKRLADLETEVHQLRNLPLSPEFDPGGRIPQPQALPEFDPEGGTRQPQALSTPGEGGSEAPDEGGARGAGS